MCVGAREQARASVDACVNQTESPGEQFEEEAIKMEMHTRIHTRDACAHLRHRSVQPAAQEPRFVKSAP